MEGGRAEGGPGDEFEEEVAGVASGGEGVTEERREGGREGGLVVRW